MLLYKTKKNIDEALRFERCMKIFFGEKAYHIAGSINNYKERKRWLLKVVKKIILIIDTLDTTENHQDLLRSNFENLEEKIRKIKNFDTQATWHTIDSLFACLGYLMGFKNGCICHTLVYWQDQNQNLTTQILSGQEQPNFQERKDINSTRNNIIKELKANGYNTFKIACIMNITEYKVKKIIKEME